MWCSGRRKFAWLLAAVLGALQFVLPVAVAAGTASACERLTFEGDGFTVCTANPKTDEIRLFLKQPDGTLYGALEALPDDGLRFATNAGMFTPEYVPAGLYVEDGKTMRSLNQVAKGYGNFHMQPNGVFWIKGATAHVTPTAAFAKLDANVDLATQSGPMLVIDGKVNGKFEPDGSSRYIRNGVGVDPQGRVVVAISEAPVSFGRFGRLFQTALKCPNALYLDGSVSRLHVGGAPREKGGRKLGPLLGVYRRAR